ncbi:MAG TPA: hypothetical protein ENH59_06620 [Bacteroidetes bacterium]|nr:hypothetical protein [Bacteroidota bacterium]
MKNMNFIAAFLIMLGTVSCVTFFNSEHDLFRVHDIYYRSWMLKDMEKGTDVFIEFRELDEDVEFTSLVFRGIEVDVNLISEGRSTIVKGTINTGPSLIENYEYKVTGETDMIKYNYRGKEFSYPLKNIRRESTTFTR